MSQPKPKPRPRPKMRNAATSGASPSTPDTAAGPSTHVDDEYDMFNRDKHNESRLRAQREERAASQTKETFTVDISDDDATSPSSPVGKRKRGPRIREGHVKIKGSAAWTLQPKRSHSSQPHSGGVRGSSTARGTDSDEETYKSSDSDIIELNDKGKKRGKSPPKRPRERERSLTPPPPISEAQKRNIRVVVTSHLAAQAYAKPDSANGPGEDEEEPASPSSPISPTVALDDDEVDRNSADCVVVNVKWEPHPFDEVAKSMPPEAYTYYCHRAHTLRTVFIKLAKKKSLPREDLVVLMDDQPITQANTPSSLAEWASVIELTACDENTYNTLLDERRAAAALAAERKAADDLAREVAAAAATNAHDDEADGGRRIKVTLRSAAHPQPVVLRIKASNTCGWLLKRYLKDRPAPSGHKGNVRLQFDGEDLDVGDGGERSLKDALTDADFDLDDEDDNEVQLDVAGL